MMFFFLLSVVPLLLCTNSVNAVCSVLALIEIKCLAKVFFPFRGPPPPGMIRPGMHPPFPPRGPEPFMHGPRPGMGPGPEHDPGFGPRPRFPMGPNGPFPGHMPGPPDGHMLGPPSKFVEDKDLYIMICSVYLKVLCIVTRSCIFRQASGKYFLSFRKQRKIG